MSFLDLLARQIEKKPAVAGFVKNLAHKISPETVALLDYPLTFRQRWSYDRPHKRLHALLNHHRDAYAATLQTFLPLADHLVKIPAHPTAELPPASPFWDNGFMPALDGVALYGFIATRKPRLYLEVGSGNSTKFARQAIADHGTGTRIISIDPCPRADINAICDEVIRQPVEDVDLGIFARLEAGDILYVDNSHRAFMNSDVTTIFVDVLPSLKPGVLVQIHDILLPYDYPLEWRHRYYSEQYLLATYLLAGGNLFEVILPNTFISHDPGLRSILAPLWARQEFSAVETHGCSFWLQIS